jgi:hypothetical protein
MPVHASAPYTLHLAQNAAVEIVVAGLRAISYVLEFAGGRAQPAEVDASRRLLLSLLQSEAPGKLRKNVRNAEICVALVGDVLREVKKSLQ